MAALIVGALFHPFRVENGDLSIGALSVDGAKITMGRPKLTGFRRDGRAYVVNAAKAIQDVTRPTVVELHDIDGDLGMGDRRFVAHLRRRRLLRQRHEQSFDLSQNVRMHNSDYVVTLNSANIDFKTGVYRSDEPVTVVMANGATIVGEFGDGARQRSGADVFGPCAVDVPARGARDSGDRRNEGSEAMKAFKRARRIVATRGRAPLRRLALRRCGEQGDRPVAAARRQHQEPVSIEADKLVYYDKEQKAVYSGNVVAIQGDTKMTCSTLTIFMEQNAASGKADAAKPSARPPRGPGAARASVKHMDCAGPVTVVSKTQAATGDSGAYDKAQNKVWLIGNVTLSDGSNVTKGEKLTYDLTTGQATVDTGPGAKRVKGLFIPGLEGRGQR